MKPDLVEKFGEVRGFQRVVVGGLLREPQRYAELDPAYRQCREHPRLLSEHVKQVLLTRAPTAPEIVVRFGQHVVVAHEHVKGHSKILKVDLGFRQ
jgi:hypothetical protein